MEVLMYGPKKKRLRINLPSRPKEEKRVQYLKDYKAWTFVCEYADWLEKDGALSL